MDFKVYLVLVMVAAVVLGHQQPQAFWFWSLGWPTIAGAVYGAVHGRRNR